MWALHAIGKLNVGQLRTLMEDREPYIRAWAVRFEREQNKVQWPGMAALLGRATEDSSPVVRLELDRTEDGSSIEAHIPRVQHEQLGLSRGQRVFVLPTSVRVFARPSDPGAARSA